jgi:propionyl-CoA synthetase
LLLSDVGWVVGHSYIVYGPLLNRCTTVIYEGKPIGTPDASNFWRTIERHRVNALFTAPTAIRVLKRADAHGLLPANFDLSCLRALFLAGERADRATIHWAENVLKIPVRDNWWQTETGWPITGNLVGVDGYIPIKYGSAFRPIPGYNLQVLDSDHNEVPNGTLGSLAIKLPLPPCSLLTIYKNDARFLSSYCSAIPGYYDSGDEGVIDSDGYVHVMSRSDDVINVSGHRLSCGAMEEVYICICMYNAYFMLSESLHLPLYRQYFLCTIYREVQSIHVL